ncbi:MogA/MoaB family molybdenum cofactor biosynthesis protein [Pseudodesulfovibrio piezophilus]|uniref:Molybdopterin adenylyltransferase n=1 Tax=Pseudodesulfovibrio piezophilus (strain DSM 21447 / JCM 15486 / C1TLV30) TaxID=1322246 RepID=M1WPX4_PSEP2|nr:MogA/MoaB family molybdenum cofactor biosynthesis protein [Pseudodesulfovibrio piezophilus]CCH47337.1 Molybdenum cofactor synthesis domain protein [Pseudodesulfovibrio piezophilus C1TLV30]
MSNSGVRVTVVTGVPKGEYHTLAKDGLLSPFKLEGTENVFHFLQAGSILGNDSILLRVVSAGWVPGCGESASTRQVVLETMTDCPQGEFDFDVTKNGYSLAWVTLSDKGAAGKREDKSGPLIAKLVSEKLDLAFVQGFIIPDDPRQLKGLLADLALVQRFDLILTTGGTGVGPRDITPEATLSLIEKRLPGYERAMTEASLSKTPHGAISRAIAGTLSETLIVNMPGSPKAVAECLEPLLPTLKHTLEKLQGDSADCASLYT